MSNNRELSESADYLIVDDTTKNVGIGTTLKISAGGIFVGNTEIVRPDGTWGGPNSGLVGAQGAQGAVGAQGAQGAVGAQGADGAQGAVGAQGAQGAQGRQGAVGAQGAAGAQGAVGAQGAQGAAGAQGAGGIEGGPTSTTVSYTSVADVNTNNSWTNFPSLSTSITTTTGKVMVHITIHLGTGNVAAVRVLQNGSVVGPTGSATGRTAAHAISNRGSDRTCPPLVLTFVHSPGTGTKSYQVQYRTQNNSWINSGSDSSNTDGNNFYTPASTLTLVEVN